MILNYLRSGFRRIAIRAAKLERQRGFGGQPHHHAPPPPPPGTTTSSSAPAWSSADGFHNHLPHYEDHAFYDSNFNHYHQCGGQFGGGAGSGSGHQGSFNGRKRPWHRQNQDQNCFHNVKLYVAQIPRTAVEQDIGSLFEQYGNIVEVVMLKEKRTGLPQGKCFVKYATTTEADKAIAGLNNLYTFPGEAVPITVRFADGEKERLGLRDKVFVAMINKEASEKELEEIFSPYGVIEDVYIMRDEMMLNRCGFVKFSHSDMASAAIQGLHGNYIMRGCDKPLAVRFAEPKKQRFGESRSNNMASDNKFGPNYQESNFSRPVHGSSDSTFGFNPPNGPYPMQHCSSAPKLQSNSFNYQEHSHFAQMPLQKMPNSLDLEEPSKKLGEQNQWPQTNGQPELLPVPKLEHPDSPEPPDCDWSEHICPDGYNYYYNCVSCESVWEKPNELALLEELSEKPREQKSPCQQVQTQKSVLMIPKLEPLDVQNQNNALRDKLQTETPSLAVSESVEVQ